MKRNATLLIELNNLLDNIKNKIKLHHNELGEYQKELVELGLIVNDSLKTSHHSAFFEKNDMVKSIMKIMHQINKSIESVELSMHGVANYSNYESHEVKIITQKQIVKNDLKKMLDLILAARPEIRNEQLARMIKQLRG